MNEMQRKALEQLKEANDMNRRILAELESGKMQTRSKWGNEDWKDTTEENKAHYRKQIEFMDGFIAEIERGT